MIPYKSVSEFTIPALWLWTWLIGWTNTPDYSQDDFWLQWLHDALELWYTHIDTAELYWWWHTEELIWKAIKWRERDSLFLSTKVYSSNLNHDNVLKSCEWSLKRLGVDTIDMYLIHAPNSAIPLNETMKAFNSLVRQGIVKNIWVSNFSIKQLEKAQSYSDYKIVNNQIEYSLITRNQWRYAWWIVNMESEIIPYCQKNGIIVTAERPLERWMLAKKWYPLLDELAKKYNKTHAQISMNWLLSKDTIITIPKSSSYERLKENIWAIWWTMDEADYDRCDATVFVATQDNSVLGK